MISKIKKELQNKKRDDRGAALVMVIIAIAFVGMLVAMILYMAYCNYLMKSNDTKAKKNFYTAEYALDMINAGLQLEVSECMSEAYVTTMNNAAEKDADVMEAEFQAAYIDKIRTKVQETSNPNKWSISHLTDFWDGVEIKKAATPGALGAHLSSDGGCKLDASANGDYLTLHDLRVVYTDDKGFVSIISTDIRLKVPTIGFAQSATKMSVENYSLIANNSLVNDNNLTTAPSGVSHGSNAIITGNVFGGYEGVVVAKQMGLHFEQDPDDKLKGSTQKYNLITDSLNVDTTSDATTGLYVDDTFVTYVNNINVQSGVLDLDGITYAGDDLEIGGKNSKVTVRGEYTGYGNTLGKADGSSSILVNGGNTTLDFSDLSKLHLSGHAYVGATKYDADKDRLAYASDMQENTFPETDKIEDEDEYFEKLGAENPAYKDTETSIPKNERDLLMGESISVKANQLLYMVPAECVGYEIATGEQILPKNPLTYDEYQKLTKQVPKLDEKNQEDIETGETVMEDVYDVVRLDKLWTKLGGISYTNDYKAVFRRVNGNVLVYLYLDFGVNETMANAFFKAYYDYDKTGIDSYVNAYISDMKWNPSLTTNNFTLAGNAFRIANGQVEFIESQLDDPNVYADMLTMQTEYSNIHEAMMRSLSPDIDALTSTQRSYKIFDSLVDKDKFTEMDGLALSDDAGFEARIVNGSTVYNGSSSDKIRLIVAKEDIYIADDFKGLAIAGGNIYVCNGCGKITYCPTEVLQAMRAKATTSSGKEVYAYEIFGINGTVSYANAGEEVEEEKVELRDLILYENWKKE